MKRTYTSILIISFLMMLMNFSQAKCYSDMYAEISSDTLVEDVIVPVGEAIPLVQEGVEVFFIVEKMPKFKGGSMDEFRMFIAQNLIYPPKAAEERISGKVFVQFAINKKGKVVDVVIVRGVHPLLDKEAVRVVKKSPDWTPGYQKGKPVKVQFTFPIVFVLTEPDPAGKE